MIGRGAHASSVRVDLQPKWVLAWQELPGSSAVRLAIRQRQSGRRGGEQIENPFVALSRQLIQASHAVTEPLFKTGAEVYDTTVNTYETGLAGPARKSVLEINKKVMDTIIPN